VAREYPWEVCEVSSRVIHSLAISGLLTLELHSLNNEGAEGNYLQTRQVEIVNKSGQIESVNAISGDMLKHIQAEHLHDVAIQDGLPLCEACRRLDANRVLGDQEFLKGLPQGASDSAILDAVLKRCAMDDAEGILITSEVGGKKRAIPRKSVVEFGWVVGRPASTHTESYFHVKYAPEGRGKGSTDDPSNLGQNIFHRPASSGQYAVVLCVDLYRLGRNDITLRYALDAGERRRRAAALLKSILFTFVKPTGAHRNTQNPHILDFTGVVTLSKTSLPAPTISALNDEFAAEVKRIAASLNRLQAQSVDTLEFSSPAGFAELVAELVPACEPYEVQAYGE